MTERPSERAGLGDFAGWTLRNDPARVDRRAFHIWAAVLGLVGLGILAMLVWMILAPEAARPVAQTIAFWTIKSARWGDYSHGHYLWVLFFLGFWTLVLLSAAAWLATGAADLKQRRLDAGLGRILKEIAERDEPPRA
ncbi:hypothetical protein [Caulobacter mirabilis]|uniref:Uncharacterized protein n=1 Tax=Caulobacter mirabilis TaxID=69666 RepID=A0A2D2AX84_9CAUL|nr:hypothetical protein [Caulobacter mirabilis]ATQ42624.1 hypothetical protein CSW64_09495 [Caulobacter mirabilis]